MDPELTVLLFHLSVIPKRQIFSQKNTRKPTSLVSSLALTKSGLHPGGSDLLSMPKPWFCAVMKAWPVIMFSTGWFWPLENKEKKKMAVVQLK